jgi:hypothetical protein
MKAHLTHGLCMSLCCMFIMQFSSLVAQPLASLPPSTSSEKNLFEAEDVLPITLKGNIREVLNSRSGTPKSFSLSLSYFKEDSSEVTVPVKVRTRGHFRRIKENCLYPPLLIEFTKKDAQQSAIFKEQRKLKLVMPCKEEKYIIREWLVYKIYNLVTPKSFRARLVKVKLEDNNKKKTVSTFYGILLEEEKQMAKRNKGVIVERKLVSQQAEINAFLSMAVFEYLVGNTDWSVNYLHNIKLLARDSMGIATTVPYDFDHAGIVAAPYAHPAEELELKSVQERRYRGYCMKDMKEFEAVIEHYNRLKNDIYTLYTGCDLLEERYVKSTIAYLDEFYKTINNTKAWQREFAFPCNNKSGNVVIKGLKGD